MSCLSQYLLLINMTPELKFDHITSSRTAAKGQSSNPSQTTLSNFHLQEYLNQGTNPFFTLRFLK